MASVTVSELEHEMPQLSKSDVGAESKAWTLRFVASSLLCPTVPPGCEEEQTPPAEVSDVRFGPMPASCRRQSRS